jgi:hypothetical protein
MCVHVLGRSEEGRCAGRSSGRPREASPDASWRCGANGGAGVRPSRPIAERQRSVLRSTVATRNPCREQHQGPGRGGPAVEEAEDEPAFFGLGEDAPDQWLDGLVLDGLAERGAREESNRVGAEGLGPGCTVGDSPRGGASRCLSVPLSASQGAEIALGSVPGTD